MLPTTTEATATPGGRVARLFRRIARRDVEPVPVAGPQAIARTVTPEARASGDSVPGAPAIALQQGPTGGVSSHSRTATGAQRSVETNSPPVAVPRWSPSAGDTSPATPLATAAASAGPLIARAYAESAEAALPLATGAATPAGSGVGSDEAESAVAEGTTFASSSARDVLARVAEAEAPVDRAAQTMSPAAEPLAGPVPAWSAEFTPPPRFAPGPSGSPAVSPSFAAVTSQPAMRLPLQRSPALPGTSAARPQAPGSFRMLRRLVPGDVSAATGSGLPAPAVTQDAPDLPVLPVVAATPGTRSDTTQSSPSDGAAGTAFRLPEVPTLRMPLAQRAPSTASGSAIDRSTQSSNPVTVREWSIDRTEGPPPPPAGAPEAETSGEAEKIDIDALEEQLLMRLRQRLRIERERSSGWI